MKYVLLFVLTFTLSIPGFAQSASSAKNITEFDVNGLKVIVKRRASSPTVSAGLFIRGGVKNQTTEKAGLESLALSIATEASTKFPRAVLRKELSRTGSSIGAGSAYDFSVVQLSSTRPNFDRTWQIFTDLVLNPAFTQSDFDLTRDRTLTALRNRGVSPDDALNSLEERIIFAGHPYAADPSGTVESIQALTLADAKTYYKKLIESSRLLLVIVGDVDPAAFQKQVTASFGKLPKGNYKEPELAKIAFTQPTLDVSQRSLPTNYVKGVFAAPSIGDPDYHAMRVAMTILQSRVVSEVRTKRNLSYAPNAEMDDNTANTAHIYVTANDANQAVSVMLNEIDGMKRETLKADQLEAIASFFLTTYYLKQETNAAQVGELALYELVGGGWKKSLGFLEGIRKVTPDEVKIVSNKYMKNLRFFLVGDPAAVNRPTFLGSE